MPLNNDELLDALDSVTSIPLIPFRDGRIDDKAHAVNIDYLMKNNHLEGGRRRVIGIAGTSLIHHVSAAEQIRLMELTGRQMGGEGVLMSGVVPNPIEDAGRIIEAQAQHEYAPDVYLLMPLTGVASPAGMYDSYMDFAARMGQGAGARFLYYLRQQSEIEVAVRLVNDSPYFVGIKIGTSEDDVDAIVNGVEAGRGIVMWGIGDRSTGAAEKGTKGHTSGINVVFARASDQINNAQRRGDWQTSRQTENEVAALEDIRFRNGRMYNYSAVVEAMHLGGFDDVEGGEGGPFNPRVPDEVAQEVKAAIAGLVKYH
ncbi:MAG: hypothetical protein GKR89_24130 [Candidatus Latescibacteria bacterium]|nr:hypothetical protein [Candidatus Latescibacterota bacterium]